MPGTSCHQIFAETFRPCGPDFSGFNVHNTAGQFRELAGTLGVAMRGEHIPMGDSAEALVLRVPFGVCLAMAPWNAAIILPVRSFAAPIITGNTVVLKTSEVSPATHAMLGQLMKDAGLPDGVLNIIHVSAKDAPTLVEKLIADRRVRHVNFTGSTRVGSIVGALAGKYIKPVLLELGGKAPSVVCEDADLDVAVSHSIFGGWFHQGQICMSTEKVIVVAPIYDAFVAKCKEVASKSSISKSPLGQAIRVGAEKAKELVDDAVKHGATSLLGDHGELKSNYLQPCILTDVTKSMRVYTEETFGPVFIILKAKDEDEAIELANDTDYGLSSAVFTKDLGKAIKLGRRIEAGATHVNSMTVGDDPAVPHGGMKSSGFGRFNSIEGLRSFTQVKVIALHGQGHAIPL